MPFKETTWGQFCLLRSLWVCVGAGNLFTTLSFGCLTSTVYDIKQIDVLTQGQLLRWTNIRNTTASAYLDCLAGLFVCLL